MWIVSSMWQQDNLKAWLGEESKRLWWNLKSLSNAFGTSSSVKNPILSLIPVWQVLMWIRSLIRSSSTKTEMTEIGNRLYNYIRRSIDINSFIIHSKLWTKPIERYLVLILLALPGIYRSNQGPSVTCIYLFHFSIFHNVSETSFLLRFSKYSLL